MTKYAVLQQCFWEMKGFWNYPEQELHNYWSAFPPLCRNHGLYVKMRGAHTIQYQHQHPACSEGERLFCFNINFLNEMSTAGGTAMVRHEAQFHASDILFLLDVNVMLGEHAKYIPVTFQT